MPEDLEFVAGNEDVKPHYVNQTLLILFVLKLNFFL